MTKVLIICMFKERDCRLNNHLIVLSLPLENYLKYALCLHNYNIQTVNKMNKLYLANRYRPKNDTIEIQVSNSFG